MSFPIVLAKSLLSLTLLSAAVPAGGAGNGSSVDTGETVVPSAGNVYVTRAVAAYDGVNVTQSTWAPIPDPLELANTYAPETVEEWTRTLEQYKEKVKPQVYRVQLKGAAGAEGTEGDVTLPMEIAIRAMPAVGLDAEGKAAPDEAAPQPVTVDIRKAVVLEDAPSKGLEPTAVPPLMKVFPLDEGIVKAQTAVAQALEAGQAEGIRTALHDLLTAYQTFLADK